MKKLIIFAVLGLLITGSGEAEDLYKVTLYSQHQAEMLKSSGVDVLFWVRGGYLLLADGSQSQSLKQGGLDLELLASDVRRDQLAIDGRFDRKNAEMFEVLYEDGRVRLLLAGTGRLALTDEPAEVFPLPDKEVKISYYPPAYDKTPQLSVAAMEDIEQLIALVRQDSLESYLLRFQAFDTRLTGTYPNYEARDWIAAKFDEFGYDSIVIDPFIGSQLWNYTPCQSYNVITYKVGNLYPERQIIIGGHFDAVPDCPGADDNASGTACVLEIARILKDIETNMTIILIAFDSEESWMWGSYHYCDAAVERNDDIVLMINPDMIAHENNDTRADLYYGPETAYASLWSQLASTHVGIIGDLSGSTASDHWPFQQAGYDVIFVQEKNFSTHYHLPSDSSVYLNFDYMTRMVKATLATLYTVDQHPPPVRIEALLEPGDGQSKIVTWQPLSAATIDYYEVSFYPIGSPYLTQSVIVPPTESSCTIDWLTEGQEYAFWVQAFDNQGRTSFASDMVYGTPSSIPIPPPSVVAMPLHNAVQISWICRNTELDFDHCAIIRDGEIVGQSLDTVYIDEDPELGSDLHYYYVTAVDTDGNHSDTVGIAPAWSKAAMLDPDRILAVNRTSNQIIDFVSAYQTGVFLQEALDGYNYDYYCDTLATKYPHELPQLDLVEMVDYGIMVVGAEAGKWDDIGDSPELRRGILDTLTYYLSIGGKLIVFGRWGDLGVRDTVDYLVNSPAYDNAYHDWFHIDYRVQTETDWPFLSTVVTCDLVGAHSKDHHYPHLFWDSLATLEHANSQNGPVTDVAGIPCATFVGLTSEVPEVIYSYDCRKKTKSQRTEGQPVAWRYLGEDYSYIYFDIPLSFFERDPAIAALRQAIDDVMSTPAVTRDLQGNDESSEAALLQNYPNPFNPTTEICYSLSAPTRVRLTIYNILGQKVTTLVDEKKPAGTYTVYWNGTDDSNHMVATGIYFYQLTTGSQTQSRKMVLLK